MDSIGDSDCGVDSVMTGSDRVLDRIASLLAKAERTDNLAEAEAYLAKAQSLATQASVDLAMARVRIARREAREQPVQRTITIGDPGKRANTHLVTLFVSVGVTNDLQMDVARNSTYVIAYGMPSDIDLCETLFGSLATQMTAAAGGWLAQGDWRDDSYLSKEGVRKQHTAQTARAAFYRGFIERIGRRLADAREEVLAEARSREVDVAVDVAVSGRATGELVLRQKTTEVHSFYKNSSTARGSWSGYSGSVSRFGGAASKAGREAATRARLATAKGIGAKGPSIPR